MYVRPPALYLLLLTILLISSYCKISISLWVVLQYILDSCSIKVWVTTPIKKLTIHCRKARELRPRNSKMKRGILQSFPTLILWPKASKVNVVSCAYTSSYFKMTYCLLSRSFFLKKNDQFFCNSVTQIPRIFLNTVTLVQQRMQKITVFFSEKKKKRYYAA